MGGTAGAKRKAKESKLHSRSNKKFKKQKHYSSGSESESELEQDEQPALLEGGSRSRSKVSGKRDQRKIPPAPPGQEKEEEGEDEEQEPSAGARGVAEGGDSDEFADSATDAQSELTDDSDDASQEDSDEDSQSQRRKTKRRDPDAFANSINAILSSKLTTTNRKDPVLSRSKGAATAAHELAESKLEVRAKRKLRDEKRALNEKGRVRNPLLGDRRKTGLSESEAEDGVLSEGGDPSRGKGTSAADIAEQERRLRKTAQRGVVKLFNAVRVAQVKAEEASKDSKLKGIVGVKRREEKVGEMGRQAFLDLVGNGKIEVA